VNRFDTVPGGLKSPLNRNDAAYRRGVYRRASNAIGRARPQSDRFLACQTSRGSPSIDYGTFTASQLRLPVAALSHTSISLKKALIEWAAVTPEIEMTPSPKECRELADACMSRAKNSRSVIECRTFLRMAEEWLGIATRSKSSGSKKPPTRHVMRVRDKHLRSDLDELTYHPISPRNPKSL
jgi:hypothetical protein